MKGKLGRFVFRKIGGKIRRIQVRNIDMTAQGLSVYAPKQREIQARVGKEVVGRMTITLPKEGKSATLKHVEVAKEYRRKGIAKNLFARAKQFLERANYRFLRSEEIINPAQIKIRSKMGGWYKAGKRSKKRTRFFADQFGPYGEHKRRVSRNEAIDILKNNEKGRQITATTMLKRMPKKYRK